MTKSYLLSRGDSRVERGLSVWERKWVFVTILQIVLHINMGKAWCWAPETLGGAHKPSLTS